MHLGFLSHHHFFIGRACSVQKGLRTGVAVSALFGRLVLGHQLAPVYRWERTLPVPTISIALPEKENLRCKCISWLSVWRDPSHQDEEDKVPGAVVWLVRSNLQLGGRENRNPALAVKPQDQPPATHFLQARLYLLKVPQTFLTVSPVWPSIHTPEPMGYISHSNNCYQEVGPLC